MRFEDLAPPQNPSPEVKVQPPPSQSIPAENKVNISEGNKVNLAVKVKQQWNVVIFCSHP